RNNDGSMHRTSLYSITGSLAGRQNISRTKFERGDTLPRTRPKSGLGGAAAGTVGPVAVEAGHAPFDALSEAGEPAILDDRIVHRTHLAVAQHHVAAAEAARDVVGLPGAERGLVDAPEAGDDKLRIPELAFLFLELRRDRGQRPLAFGDAAVIAGAEQSEIELQRIGGLCGRAGGQHGKSRRYRA